MTEHELGTVIGRREFELDGKRTVVAVLGMPYQADEVTPFACPFQLEGIGDSRIWRVYGDDSVQALVLALQMVASLLYTSEEYKAGRLTFLGMRNLGLPVSSIIADLVPPEDE